MPLQGHPTGTLVASALTNGAAAADYGTHYSFLGIGGWVEMPTVADMRAIPVKDTLNGDGVSSGRRRAGMAVFVFDDADTTKNGLYTLKISGFMGLSDAAKLAALANNANWTLLKTGGGDDVEGEDVFTVTAELIDAVVLGTYNEFNEMTSALPEGSAAGKWFDYEGHGYVCMPGGSTGTLTWNKYRKKGGLGGGGGVAPAETITHAALLTRLAANALTPGQEYRVTARPATAYGHTGDVLIRAASASVLEAGGRLYAKVPDYAAHPTWAPPTGEVTYAASPAQAYQRLNPDSGTAPQYIYGDDNAPRIALPFPFAFKGVTYNHVQADTNGRVMFVTDAEVETGLLFNSSYSDSFIPFSGATAHAKRGVAVAWNDYDIRTGASPNGYLAVYTVGTAPNRRMVFDWYEVSVYNNTNPNKALFNGQIRLVEGTNALEVGVATLPSLAYGALMQGLYFGDAHQLTADEHTPLTTGLRTFSVVPPAVGPPPSPTIWDGRTWKYTGGSEYGGAEPGTSAEFAVNDAPGADAFGNALDAADAVLYAPLTDTIRERRDRHGNTVRANGLEFFGWGNPNVRNNTVHATSSANNLRKVAALENAFSIGAASLAETNTFTIGTPSGPNAVNTKVSRIQFADNTFITTAPVVPPPPGAASEFTPGVTLLYNYLGAMTNGAVTPNAVNTIVDYLQGQFNAGHIVRRGTNAPVYRAGGFGILNPDNTDHDLIEMLGTHSAFFVQNRDYNFKCWNSQFGNVWTSSNVSVGRNITITGATSTGSWYVHDTILDANDPNSKGSNTTMNYCNIAAVVVWQLASGGHRDRHTFNDCNIGVVTQGAAYLSVPGHKLIFNRCSFGRTVTSGHIFASQYGEGTIQPVVRNSVIHLNGTAQLHQPGVGYPHLTFQNCTVIRADGTSYPLDNTPESTVVSTWPVFNQAGGNASVPSSQFTALPLGTGPAAIDTHNGWNGTAYVVPQTGTYQVEMNLRILDNTHLGISYGMGAGTALVDDAAFGWRTTPAAGPSTVRHGAIHQRTMNLTKGDLLRYYGYFDGLNGNPVFIAACEITVLRVR